MTSGQEKSDRLSWLEALHEAIVADEDDAFLRGDSEVSPVENVDAIRDCLRKLEDARRAGDWSQSSPAADSWPGANTPKRIGKFKIIRTLGGGGQGIVFLALDTELRRQVALKVPKPEALVSPDARRRFLREAHAAAGLSHPGIVTVHEIAEAFPTCYLVSDYCPGGSLQQYLQDHAQPVSPQAAAQLVAELAAGVHYAHLHGVLHRDIKPSNVFLVERHDEVREAHDPLLRFVPKLGDFGLARLAENDGERTATGAILGTPAYMSPEQAGGRTTEVCPATDVYGLGTVLYELLTGRPTFRGVTDADTLRQVLFVEPAPLRTLNPRVPRDLEAVCLRALDKDPNRRYSSAAALADDLHRYQEGRPTLVRPLTPVGKLWRVARRRPAIATLAALLSVAVLVASALFVTSAIEQRRLNAQLIEQRLTAEKHAREATDLAYAADMQLADLAWRKNDIAGLESILARYVPPPGQYDPRGVEWRYLQTRLQASSQVLVKQNGPGGCARFSPDGRWLVTGSHDGKIRIWEMPQAKLKWTIEEEPLLEINAFAFSPDGRTLAAASNASRVLLCDLATGKFQKALKGGHTEWVSDVDFSPDGERLCSVSGDGTIALWNWKTGQRIQRFRGHTQELRSVRFTQDGQHVITGGQKGIVQIWELVSEKPVASVVVPQRNPTGTTVWPRDIALSADRARMAVCWDIGGLMVYDLTDVRNPRLTESMPQEVGNQVDFLSDRQLAVGSEYGKGRIWTLGHNEPDRPLLGHRDKIVSISAAPDGRWIATTSKDRTVRLWTVDAEDDGQELAHIAGRCDDLEISPAGDELALEFTYPRRVVILNPATGEVQTEHAGLEGTTRCLAYVNEGQQLAIAVDASILFYERPSGKLLWQWTRPQPSPTGNTFEELWSAGSLLVVKEGHDIWALDIEKRSLAWHRDLVEGLWGGVASPDKQVIYIGDQIGRVHALRLTDGRTIHEYKGRESPVNELAASADGHFLLTASNNREIRLWDRTAGTMVRHLASGDDSLGTARFTADGKTIIARHDRYHLGFWHVTSGQRLLTTGPWGDENVCWGLSHDGRTIYITVHHGEETSVRMLTLDAK